MAEVVWRPDARTLEHANVSRLMRRHGYEDYWELVRRSQEDPEWFWPAAIEDMGLDFAAAWEAGHGYFAWARMGDLVHPLDALHRLELRPPLG